MRHQEHGPHINYIVRRTFTDAHGTLRPGDRPASERVAQWPHTNLRALVNCGNLEVDGTRADAPQPAEVMRSAPKAKTAAKQKRPHRRANVGPHACPVEGCEWRGERVKAHITRSHS